MLELKLTYLVFRLCRAGAVLKRHQALVLISLIGLVSILNSVFIVHGTYFIFIFQLTECPCNNSLEIFSILSIDNCFAKVRPLSIPPTSLDTFYTEQK